MFKVIDTNTNEEVDLSDLEKEEWVKSLTYFDLQGFALDDEENLMLIDECGNYIYCPIDRFQVVYDIDFIRRNVFND